MGLRRYLAILTVLVVVILAVITYVIPPGGDFRSENPSWNGLADTAAPVGVTPVGSVAEIPEPFTGKGLIVVPYLELPPETLQQLGEFVNGGGVLILADDYGFGNTILNYLDVGARFSNKTLLDPVVCYKNRFLPLIVRFDADPVTSGITEIVFNHPGVLIGLDEENIVAWSSSLSFVDDNGNGEWNAGEVFGPHPVIARLGYGDGQLILLSDPSVFINSSQSLGDNAQLLQNIAGLTENGLFFVESTLPRSELDTSKDLLHNLRDFMSTPLGMILLITAVIAAVVMLAGWPPQTQGRGGGTGA
ncbi:hypothetical protein Dform_01811 [Dehalogenimonas formicexedens]|uniref:DUF4350 domain-containing protein n=1 Tax=Dehalogenimonas formicexedens TaxID=1839801 RepID=A0A1P8F9L8_9CHLR|nr:DUF4350 domain-containing protein [Dehalogenimonas formicexedens]APV45130.1 hypothetical protein Dform_01811 [Dehalogenimonas formicexedens]